MEDILVRIIATCAVIALIASAWSLIREGEKMERMCRPGNPNPTPSILDVVLNRIMTVGVTVMGACILTLIWVHKSPFPDAHAP